MIIDGKLLFNSEKRVNFFSRRRKNLAFLSDSALYGFRNAFALGGHPIRFPEQNYNLRDSIAIMSDWEEVGNELYKAQEHFKRTEFSKILANKE